MSFIIGLLISDAFQDQVELVSNNTRIGGSAELLFVAILNAFLWKTCAWWTLDHNFIVMEVESLFWKLKVSWHWICFNLCVRNYIIILYWKFSDTQIKNTVFGFQGNMSPTESFYLLWVRLSDLLKFFLLYVILYVFCWFIICIDSVICLSKSWRK